MLQTLKNAWNTKDIRTKIIFTLFIILLYRVGTVIPVPFVEANNFAQSFSGTILDYMNTLSGGSLGTATLFALGVSPYINASIIIQLLAVVFPKLGELAKNDKKKMNFITRITTVILAIVTAIGYYFLLKNNNMLSNAATPGEGEVAWLFGIAIVVCYVAGTAWFMVVYAQNTGPVGLWTALLWCVVPFIVPDLAKLGLALWLSQRLEKITRSM